jgi:hypothetical protein
VHRSLELFATLSCLVGCTSQGSGNTADGGMVLGDDAAIPGDAAAADGLLSSDATITGPDVVSPDAASRADDGAGQQADAECVPAELPSPTCNTIVASGAVVTSSSQSGSPPEAQGGIIPDGTYVLVSSTYYGGYSPPADFQTTWVVCGDHWDVAENALGPDGGGGEIVHADFTVSVQDAGIVLTQTCNSIANNYSEMRGFTVSGNQITFVQSTNGLTLVSTFDRQ